MGRGRQKAKQTKVARDLKYYSPPTDLTALQRELQSGAAPSTRRTEDREEWSDDSSWSESDSWAARNEGPSAPARRR
ncbi:DUF3073 domain-containing protein [Brachybacterium sp. JHP9]|uniref:DUF3073 domain-containing protein n=1 Tax=Brachybacterium equifaecis TaxID=2910770 RepID=A0ABT0R1V4_9MICO|nr:DUF3073 domain-containing protein [Brachybacterium equifaecis]MCL6422905.1 DUF3073 domain-containing protein [Brachybacterium equifaecis]